MDVFQLQMNEWAGWWVGVRRCGGEGARFRELSSVAIYMVYLAIITYSHSCTFKMSLL